MMILIMMILMVIVTIQMVDDQYFIYGDVDDDNSIDGYLLIVIDIRIMMYDFFYGVYDG